jgi:hypothetical protein
MQYYDGFSRGCAYRRVMHAKFGLLTGGNRTAVPRQQTLHALQRGGGAAYGRSICWAPPCRPRWMRSSGGCDDPRIDGGCA